jgi:hypothetical protein
VSHWYQRRLRIKRMRHTTYSIAAALVVIALALLLMTVVS